MLNANSHPMVMVGLLVWLCFCGLALAYEAGASSMSARNRWRRCTKCRELRAKAMRESFEQSQERVRERFEESDHA